MNGSWTMPENLPALANDKLQIRRIDLGDAVAVRPERQLLLDQAYGVLTLEEREHAARMRSGGPREEFVVGRGCLRRLLGFALQSDPAALVLEKGKHGKPLLQADPGAVLPAFNVAHSHGIILIGLSTVGEIGVDVEFIGRDIELYDIARAAFHVDDLARVKRAATLDEGLDEFYRCWTRKEAVAKADGRGLTLEPTEFAAGSDTGGVQVVTLPGASSGQSFQVRDLDVGSAHHAAVATIARDLSPCCYMLAPRSPLFISE